MMLTMNNLVYQREGDKKLLLYANIREQLIKNEREWAQIVNTGIS